jgi:hypothetical protein
MTDKSARPDDDSTNASNWEVFIHSMAGTVFVVPCPQQALTLLIDVKRNLEMQNPEWPAERQCLTTTIKEADHESASEPESKRQCVTAHDNGGADVQDSANSITSFTTVLLQDHFSLCDCGLTNGSSLDLVVKEIDWRMSDVALQEKLMSGGPVADFSNTFNGDHFDEQSAAAVAFVLSVRSLS